MQALLLGNLTNGVIDSNVQNTSVECIVETTPVVFILPKNFSFITFQLSTYEGKAHLEYTAEKIEKLEVKDNKVDIKFNTVKWDHGEIDDNKIEFIEHALTAVVIYSTGRAKFTALIKDGQG
jgi:hypothetical protein